jgi:peptide/nickel transport system substrate-binding protein
LGKPLIKKINIVSFASEKELVKALANGSLNQAGSISPDNALSLSKDGFKINSVNLPRVFGIFFNSDKNKIFADKNIIKALNKAIDRQEIVDKVLSGYGEVIDSPIPKKIIDISVGEKFTATTIEEINKDLEEAGWKLGKDGIRIKGGKSTETVIKKVNGKNVKKTVTTNTPEVRLAFSITTGDTPELKQAVSIIREQLLKIGVEVDTKKVYETGQINQLIHARDYEALFFGQIIYYESDLYSYWHSSQKTGPGLNIGLYDNKKVNTILESVQKTTAREDRLLKYEELNKEFKNNIPAIMIYSPLYLYATSNRLTNLNLSNITIPSDRFLSVYLWSADTDRIYKIFIKK